MNNYRVKIIFSVLGIAVFVAMFFYSPSVMISGVSNGLNLCGTAVIPPLFPFIFLSDFLIRSGLCDILGNSLTPVTKFIFNLPGSAGCAIFMSMIGGYPVGAKMISQLIEKGSITARQGRRMMTFCINAGPAFVIGTVGTVILSIRKAGIILYLSMIISALFTGVFLRLFDNEPVNQQRKNTVFDPSVMTQSILGATNSMLLMCAWILLFSCINSLVKSLPLKETTVIWFSIIAEVTGACAEASKLFPVSIQALVMGWAGLSVHCQIYSFVKSTELKMSHFFLSRLVHGGLATAVASVLFKVFPCEVSVFSTASDVLPAAFSVSAPAAAAMLILCAFLITDISCKKTNSVL